MVEFQWFLIALSVLDVGDNTDKQVAHNWRRSGVLMEVTLVFSQCIWLSVFSH